MAATPWRSSTLTVPDRMSVPSSSGTVRLASSSTCSAARRRPRMPAALTLALTCLPYQRTLATGRHPRTQCQLDMSRLAPRPHRLGVDHLVVLPVPGDEAFRADLGAGQDECDSRGDDLVPLAIGDEAVARLDVAADLLGVSPHRSVGAGAEEGADDQPLLEQACGDLHRAPTPR